jgi:3D (Asp-Asp-Asp) domain-containing protein
MKFTNKAIIFWISVFIAYTIIVGSIGVYIGKITADKTETQISATETTTTEETTTKPIKETTTKRFEVTKTTNPPKKTTTTKKVTTTEKETTTEATTTTTTTTEEITAKETDESEVVSLGTFKLTAYCNCEICCGVWSGGATASGVMPRSSRTIAVDTDIIPFGTEVYINGNVYIAEDTGSAIIGNRIDIYMDSHSVAQEFGVQYAEVFVER